MNFFKKIVIFSFIGSAYAFAMDKGLRPYSGLDMRPKPLAQAVHHLIETPSVFNNYLALEDRVAADKKLDNELAKIKKLPSLDTKESHEMAKEELDRLEIAQMCQTSLDKAIKDTNIRKIAYKALSDFGVKLPSLILIENDPAQKIHCAGHTYVLDSKIGVRINLDEPSLLKDPIGVQRSVILHEAAHIKCGHRNICHTRRRTYEQVQEIEREADHLASQHLKCHICIEQQIESLLNYIVEYDLPVIEDIADFKAKAILKEIYKSLTYPISGISLSSLQALTVDQLTDLTEKLRFYSNKFAQSTHPLFLERAMRYLRILKEQKLKETNTVCDYHCLHCNDQELVRIVKDIPLLKEKAVKHQGYHSISEDINRQFDSPFCLACLPAVYKKSLKEFLLWFDEEIQIIQAQIKTLKSDYAAKKHISASDYAYQLNELCIKADKVLQEVMDTIKVYKPLLKI